MNSLSWFVYLVQFVDSMSTVLGWLAGGTIALFCARYALVSVEAADVGAEIDPELSPFNSKNVERKRVENTYWKQHRPQFPRYVGAFVAFVVLSNILPTRQTMLLIAGSEIGERTLKSDAVQAVVDPGMDLLKLWIKQERDKLMKAATEKAQ